VAASPLLLVLDWKGGGGEAHAAQLLRELGLTARTVVSTGEAAALLRFRSSDPELLTGLTLDGSSGWRLAVSMLLRIREARARAVMLEWHSAHRITVAAARVAGCGVFFWTVNRPEDYRRLLRYRPDGIMSDRFELLPDAGNSVSRGPGGAA
jgi:glycerophosphoryl diester phosphodiesterase